MSTQTLKVTKNNIAEHLINKMFEIIDSKETCQNLIDTNNKTWLEDYTWNKQQETDFKAYALPLLKKIYKLPVILIKKKLTYFMMCYGLKRNDYEE